jgi:hypothetical protein
VRHFNARLSVKRSAGFWPTIATAFAAEHHWVVIVYNSCKTVVDFGLRVKGYCYG